jgi:predicted GNAT family acetyltransferase
VEAHVAVANTAAGRLFESLGFEAVEHGTVFRHPGD